MLGIIFLRFADNNYRRYEPEFLAEYEKKNGTRMERVIEKIAIDKCGFYLPKEARYDYLLSLPAAADVAAAIKLAMNLIEKHKTELDGVLPANECTVLNRTEEFKGFHHEFKVKPPVVTTGRSGSQGQVLLVHTNAWPLNTALCVKDFCGNSPFLVYYTLKNMGLEKFNSGAGVPSLNRNHLTSIKFSVPDAALQKRFDEVVGPIHGQKEQLVKMNEALRQTRDLLLPRLISGKLRVDALDIQFPPSMVEH